MSASTRYLGFDIATYPGDATMGWLWGHGFRISGFYLNHHRGEADETWIARRRTLAAAGWGLAPLYLGWQTVDIRGHRLPPPPNPQTTGAADAAEAVALMQRSGFSPGSAVHFDIEDGTVPAGAYEQYLLAWKTAVAAAGFSPAVYCSHLCNAWAAANSLPHWCFRLVDKVAGPYDPARLPQPPIEDGSLGVQFLQQVHLAGLPVAVDLDWFAVPDPASAHAASQADA